MDFRDDYGVNIGKVQRMTMLTEERERSFALPAFMCQSRLFKFREVRVLNCDDHVFLKDHLMSERDWEH